MERLGRRLAGYDVMKMATAADLPREDTPASEIGA